MTEREPFSSMSNLLGMPVADAEGAAIGSVAELLIDRNNGRVAYVQIQLDSGGGLPDTLLTVPWSSIRPTAATQDAWRLRVGRAALESLVRSRLN